MTAWLRAWSHINTSQQNKTLKFKYTNISSGQ